LSGVFYHASSQLESDGISIFLVVVVLMEEADNLVPCLKSVFLVIAKL
jgi:hypothetical protein